MSNKENKQAYQTHTPGRFDIHTGEKFYEYEDEYKYKD